MTGVFADSCGSYASAGWPCVIPVPPEAKFPPPEGFTGAAGADTDTAQLATWAQALPDYSVALRLPDGVIGIDVDHYDKGGVAKRGNDTLAGYEAQWGPLPPTWCSTARGTPDGPGPSRILFFLVPAGLRYTTRLGADIDVIQHHHRYAVVAPSPHSTAGTAYRWYGPDGRPADEVPGPGSLGILPASWVHGLTEGAAAASPAAADRSSGDALLQVLLADVSMPCAAMDQAGRTALDDLAGALAGSRHDMMTGHVYQVVQLGAEGHPGCGWVLQQWLGARWDELTAGEDRDAEFDNMLLTASRKAVTKQGGPYRADRDPCLAAPTGWEGPLPPADDSPPPADMLEHPPPWSPREAWGAHQFTTQAQADSLLARDVLARTYPALRYATDAGTWLVRESVKWKSNRADLSKWAVDQMFWLMPLGNPDAPDGSDLQLEAARRARFGTNASSNAIAAKMATQVMTSGNHPCALELAELDTEPDILWAGGVAWDIAASAQAPVIATRVDPGTPHLHTAACVPRQVPTPLFDAFCAAVWPDEAMRHWGLRTLSVAFTGHPDKTLPILYGATDRGKTELVKLIMSVLGSYALKSADSRLLSAADRSHASIVYALKGCRLAFIDEAPRAGHQAQERLKALTGGAPLTGNRMGENPITFTPTHTLILTANNEPNLDDPAVARRVRLLVCEGDPGQVRAARTAIGFLSGPAWRAEAPGVLALMMGHAGAWLADPASADNSAAPEQVRRLTQEIILAQDMTGTWVADETEPWAQGTRAGDLYKNFVASCRDRGTRPEAVPNETKWGRRLTELGFPSDRRRDGKYRPLRVRTTWGAWTPPSAEAGGSARPAISVPDISGPENGLSSPASAGTGSTRSMPPVTSESAENVTSVTSSVTSSEQTGHTQNTSSNYTQPVTVTSVYSTTPTTRAHAHDARAHAHTRESDIQETGHTGHNWSQPQVSSFSGESKLVTEPCATGHGLAFDLETADAGDLFTYQPHDETGFIRLAGAIGPDGEPAIVPVPELLARLEQAGEITGHNILGFDLVALARHHGANYARLAAKARDTELIARQANPPRSRESGTSLDRYDLDHVAESLGVAGKTDNLARLKRKHKGYDQIPLDDQEYRSYLKGDLRATAAVSAVMAATYPPDPYIAREHKLAAIAGQMTLNGFRVDRALLEQRQRETAESSRVALLELHDLLNLPLSKTVRRGRGKARHEEEEPLDSPVSSAAGREWLAGVWDRYGVTDPPRTGKTKVLSVGADDLRAVARQYPALAGLCELIVKAAWPRTVYQTAADCLTAEDRVHPGNSFRQASGRWSVTNPGLTVYGKHGGRHHERDIFLPDPGHALLSFDLSQVDMRAMAGHSQDPAYMALFAPGRDAHAEIAAQVGLQRQDAKAIGHGWNYGLGPARMIANGLDPAKVHAFIAGMEQRFPVLIAWREHIREIGKSGAILDNGFGRQMRCDPARAYTVAPALMGQGGARDIMCDCLLRLPREIHPMLRVMVHDEILLSVPGDLVLDVIPVVKQAMTTTWRNVPITCDMTLGATWGECSAK